MGWLCFADWNLKGRIDFAVPETGRTVPGRPNLVVDTAAESCSIAAELNWVHGQPMRAQGVWVMKKGVELFCPSEQTPKSGSRQSRGTSCATEG